jgi:DNA-3-methyladenine glycosylase II
MSEYFDSPILTEKTFFRGISELTRRDLDLAAVVSRWGEPPFWTHTPGFPGIVLAILSQQVSLESAQAAFTRLEEITNTINPVEFLSLDNHTLKTIGFSRQKASYVQGIAREILDGEFDLEALESMENEQVRERLMQVRGIGAWTANTYLLFALRRSDAWPTGDLALAKAIQELRGWDNIPSFEEVDRIADRWRPWRAVAARILWHYYLSERGRAAST